MWRGALVLLLAALFLSGCQLYLDSRSSSAADPFERPCGPAGADDAAELLGKPVQTAQGSPDTSGEQNQGYRGVICAYDTGSGTEARDIIFVTYAARDNAVNPPPGSPQDIEAFCVDRAFLERTNTGTPEPVAALGETAYYRSSTGLYFVRSDVCVNVDAFLLDGSAAQTRDVELRLGEVIAEALED